MIERWIASWHDTAGRVDGLATVAAGFWAVLEQTLGAVATRAIVNRALHLASKQEPRLAGIAVAEHGVELAGLRAALADERSDRAGIVAVTFLDELFSVLFSLIGSALLPLLREVEAEIESSQRGAISEEEQ